MARMATECTVEEVISDIARPITNSDGTPQRVVALVIVAGCLLVFERIYAPDICMQMPHRYGMG